MKIKKAKLRNIKTILKCFNLLTMYESKFDKDLKFDRNEVMAKILKALADKNVAYFIAYSGKTAVGCAEVYMKGRVAIMSSVFVHLSSRGSGVGSALFRSVRSWAKKKKAESLRLHVYKKNTSAIKYWEMAGFKKTGTRRKLVFMQHPL